MCYIPKLLLFSPAPGKPENFKVSKLTSHSAHLLWRPGQVSNMLKTTSYEVQYREALTGNTSWLSEATESRSNNLNVSSLTPFTVYSFRVRGINILGPGLFSDELSNMRTLEAGMMFIQ